MCLAVPGKVIRIDVVDEWHHQAWVDFSGTQRSINLSYVPEAAVGDFVQVHAGFAISVLDEGEAGEILAAFAAGELT